MTRLEAEIDPKSIRLDLTSLDSGMSLESTSNDFSSSEVMMNLRK